MGFFKTRSEETIAGIKRRMEDTVEVRARRRDRLTAIRERMQLNVSEFADLLGFSRARFNALFARGQCPLGWVKLAEYELERYLSKQEGIRRRQRGKAEAAIPDSIKQDAQLKASVFRMYLQAKTEAEITKELALRPGVVAYFIGLMR